MSYITGIHTWVGKMNGNDKHQTCYSNYLWEIEDGCTVLQWVQCIWLLISCFAFLFVCQIFRKSGKIKFVFLYLSIYPHAHSLSICSFYFGCVPVCVCVHAHSFTQSCPTLWGPMTYSPSRLLCPWDFPGKNMEVDCHFLLQGIFPIRGSNSHLLPLLDWQVDSLPLHYLGSPVWMRPSYKS